MAAKQEQLSKPTGELYTFFGSLFCLSEKLKSLMLLFLGSWKAGSAAREDPSKEGIFSKWRPSCSTWEIERRAPRILAELLRGCLHTSRSSSYTSRSPWLMQTGLLKHASHWLGMCPKGLEAKGLEAKGLEAKRTHAPPCSTDARPPAPSPKAAEKGRGCGISSRCFEGLQHVGHIHSRSVVVHSISAVEYCVHGLCLESMAVSRKPALLDFGTLLF